MKSHLAALCLTLGAAGGLGAPAAAQQLTLEWTGGVLGTSVRFDIEGPAGSIYALIPSQQGGPTPLSIISPGDPRVLSVGFDLIPNWSFGVLAGPGSPSQVFYPMPAAPALSGTTFYTQAITFPGAVFLVDLISNPTRWVGSFRDEFQRTTTDNVRNRRWHTATTLDDGSVLVAGGFDRDAAVPEVLSTWELYRTETQELVAGGTLPERRVRHTATKLQDGRVLLVGGVDPNGNALASTVLIDPAGATAIPGPRMPALRVHHTATLLNDGRVLVVGGATRSSFGQPLGFPASFQFQGPLQTHLYDPVQNAWQPGPTLPQPRIGHGAAKVGDGRVLIAGGVSTGVGGGTLTGCLIYDPATNQLLPTAPLPRPLAFHAMGSEAGGRVMVVSGANIDPGTLTVATSNASFRYSLGAGQPPSAGSWSPPISTGANGVYLAGEIICIPAGMYPIGSPFIIIIDGVIYIVLGGYADVDLQTGMFQVNDHLLRTDANAAAWTDVGTSRSVREGLSAAVIDEGLRVLLSGVGVVAGGLVDPRSETWVR